MAKRSGFKGDSESKAQKKNVYDDAFLTPLSEQKLHGEPGPDVFNPPVLTPADPLGFVPGGAKGGSIKGRK